MNATTFSGEGQGLADQISGKARRGIATAKDALANSGPLAERARRFARERPFATAALAGVVGLALLNTLRGR